MSGRAANHEVLETDRLRLRRPSPPVVELIYAIHSDARACHYNPSDMIATRAEAEALYVRWDEHWEHNGFGYWVVHLDDSAIGFCGLKIMTLNDRVVLNLFYRLTPRAWARGFATEAASAVVAWADVYRPGDTVIARVRPANVASLKVAERAGLSRMSLLDTQGEDGLDWIYSRPSFAQDLMASVDVTK
jgi:RimJ/RimL family protein N-acetyltransferase